MLLRPIAFDIYLNLSQVIPENHTEDYHSILLFRNVLKDDDLYLVDVDAAHPAFQAIVLDFIKESPVYHDSYSFYKFVRMEDEIILHVLDTSFMLLSHGRSSEMPTSGDFMPFYAFKINPTIDIYQVREQVNVVYTDPDLSPFHKHVRAIKLKDKKLALISNSKLVLEAEDGSKNYEILADDESIVVAYKQQFPELDEACVRKALQNWRSNRTESEI